MSDFQAVEENFRSIAREVVGCFAEEVAHALAMEALDLPCATIGIGSPLEIPQSL